MIDESTTATTAEILLLVDLSKQRLSQLEQAEIIRRLDKDKWPLVQTVKALLADARRRSSEYSEAKSRFEKLKADRERLKLEKESGQLCKVSDFDDAWVMVIGAITSRLVALPNRVTRDLSLRKAIEQEIDKLRTEVADEAEKWANELGGKGKAA